MFVLIWHNVSEECLATLRGDGETILQRIISVRTLNEIIANRIAEFLEKSSPGDLLCWDDWVIVRVRSAITIGIESVFRLKEGAL